MWLQHSFGKQSLLAVDTQLLRCLSQVFVLVGGPEVSRALSGLPVLDLLAPLLVIIALPCSNIFVSVVVLLPLDGMEVLRVLVENLALRWFHAFGARVTFLVAFNGLVVKVVGHVGFDVLREVSILEMIDVGLAIKASG